MAHYNVQMEVNVYVKTTVSFTTKSASETKLRPELQPLRNVGNRSMECGVMIRRGIVRNPATCPAPPILPQVAALPAPAETLCLQRLTLRQARHQVRQDQVRQAQ